MRWLTVSWQWVRDTQENYKKWFDNVQFWTMLIIERNLIMLTKERVEATAARVALLLASPKLAPCRHNSIVTSARMALVRQLWYLDRIVSALRDGEDYTGYAEEMGRVDLSGVRLFVESIRGV